MALIRPIADFVVALGSDGRIASQGSLDKALLEDHESLDKLKADEDEPERADSEIGSSKVGQDAKDGKLVVAEEINEERVGRSACGSDQIKSIRHD